MTTQQAGDISDNGRIGMFGVGARRFFELGYMRDVKKTDKVFMGEFYPPLTMEKFLAYPSLQEQIFTEDMKERCTKIHHGELSSFLCDDVTLSGVLGLTHCAGIKGAISWLSNESDMERFPNTTQIFSRANGIF